MPEASPCVDMSLLQKRPSRKTYFTVKKRNFEILIVFAETNTGQLCREPLVTARTLASSPSFVPLLSLSSPPPLTALGPCLLAGLLLPPDPRLRPVTVGKSLLYHRIQRQYRCIISPQHILTSTLASSAATACR